MTQPRTWLFETAVRTLWQEARSEPIEGQRAVAHALWNRLETSRWGTTLAAVCMAPERFPSEKFVFSGWNAHDPNHAAVLDLGDDDPVLCHLREIFVAAQNAPDPTGGALCYYNPRIAPKPSWAFELKFCGQFGSQMFYRDNPATGAIA